MTRPRRAPGSSRVTRLIRCPAWAVKLTFALEAKRLKVESRRSA